MKGLSNDNLNQDKCARHMDATLPKVNWRRMTKLAFDDWTDNNLLQEALLLFSIIHLVRGSEMLLTRNR